MRRIAKFLIRLYPVSWRARYGEEFRALIEDAPPRWSSLFDLLGGAMKMQFSNLTFTRLAVAFSLSGLLVGFGASYLFAPTYVSSAQLMMTPGTMNDRKPDLQSWLYQLENDILSRTSLSRVIQDPRLELYKVSRQTEPLEDVIEHMRIRDLKITSIQRPGLANNSAIAFMVEFRYADPRKARAVVQTMITKLQEVNLTAQRESAQVRAWPERDEVQQLQSRVAALEKRLGIAEPQVVEPSSTVWLTPPGVIAAIDGVNLIVTDPPSYPELPASPNRAIFAAFGFAGGLLLAVLIVFVRPFRGSRHTELKPA